MQYPALFLSVLLLCLNYIILRFMSDFLGISLTNTSFHYHPSESVHPNWQKYSTLKIHIKYQLFVVQFNYFCNNSSVVHILMIFNWFEYHYDSLCSNWQNFTTCLVYCIKWTDVLDTLYQDSILISVIFNIHQVMHKKILTKYAFLPYFCQFGPANLGGWLCLVIQLEHDCTEEGAQNNDKCTCVQRFDTKWTLQRL